MTPVAAPASTAGRKAARSYSCSTRGRSAGGGGAAVVLVVVGEEVLEHRGGAQVLRVVTGQAPAVGDRQPGGVHGVLGVALLVASPARVAQQVHHRRPDLQAVAARCRRPAGGGGGRRAARPRRPRRPRAPGPRPRSRRGPRPAGRPSPRPSQATPCRASVPVRNARVPAGGSPGAYWCSIAIRSSGVSWASRSSTRWPAAARGRGTAGGRRRTRAAELTWRYPSAGRIAVNVPEALRR